MHWLDVEYFGNSVRLWIVAAGLLIGFTLVAKVVKAFVVRRAGRLAKESSTAVDDVAVDVLKASRLTSIVAVGFYLGTRVLELPAQGSTLVRVAITLALAYQAVVWGNVLIGFWLQRQFTRPDLEPGQGVGYGAVRFVARVVLWTVIVLLALDNLGIEVTALVAGLGVGGIAVALAVQNILGDIFCSLSIVLDKPFEVGDFIIVGDMMGAVENIGIKTTRVRSLGGEQLVFSNSDLVNSRVRNYKRMWERRIVFGFGVLYQTPVAQMERIPDMVREIFEGIEDTRLDRVHFNEFGESSLNFEVVYYVLEPDYNIYMDRQQAINLALMKTFEAEGIEFAYPTRTIFIEDDRESVEVRATG